VWDEDGREDEVRLGNGMFVYAAAVRAFGVFDGDTSKASSELSHAKSRGL
jgi:hypothetical protein